MRGQYTRYLRLCKYVLLDVLFLEKAQSRALPKRPLYFLVRPHLNHAETKETPRFSTSTATYFHLSQPALVWYNHQWRNIL